MSSEFSGIKGQRSRGAKAQRELIADYGDLHGLFIATPMNSRRAGTSKCGDEEGAGLVRTD